MWMRSPDDVAPAQVYASYPRQGGGRTHLMPVTLWASEVNANTASRQVSAWIVPMMVHTGSQGEPLSIEMASPGPVQVDTP